MQLSSLSLTVRGKFLDWLHGTHGVTPTILNPSSSTGLLTIFVGLYLIVHLLFATGGVLSKAFGTIIKLVIEGLRFVPTLKQKINEELRNSLVSTVPAIVNVAWDTCVVIFAIIPALKYAIEMLGKP